MPDTALTGAAEWCKLTVFQNLDELCGGAERLAIAASGGSDSTALLLLAQEWAGRTNTSLVVFTVDHDLRDEAADEARWVEQLCSTLGVEHQTLKWAKSAHGASRARTARHTLLAEAARAKSARHILLGHTLDDQIETYLIRKQQGSKAFGLGGMDRAAPSPVWPAGHGITLIRPLLDCRRDALRRVLRSRRVAWIDDPTNSDHNFERVRVRAALTSDPALAEAALEQQHRCQQMRRGELVCRAHLLRDTATVEADGKIVFSPGSCPSDRLAACLGILIQIAAGHDRQLRSANLKSLADAWLESRLDKVVTYGGAWLQRVVDHLVIGRDPGEVDRQITPDGIWDGRFGRAESDMPTSDHRLQRRTLPPEDRRWRALGAVRLAHMCDIWCTANEKHATEWSEESFS
ncbi:MAG: tRNA lysidine(34) synthetase TilS [Pseudomonadota bacterium]